jgi:hypothetical protein
MKRNKKVTISINGAQVTCDKEDLSSVMSALTGTAPAVANKPADTILVKGSELKRAFDKVVAEAPDQFILKCLALPIVNNRGIHTVYTGMNDLLRKKFPGINPVELTTQMEQAGLIKGRSAPGGHSISLNK